MARYQWGSIVVQAEQFFQDEYDATDYLPPGVCDCGSIGTGPHCHGLGGLLLARHNDWIVITPTGNVFPHPPELFEAVCVLLPETAVWAAHED